MRAVSGRQLTLSLEPGLLQRYKTLREVIAHSVMNDPRGAKGVAADCDLSVSELSRKINKNPNDPRSLDVDEFVSILDSTEDLMPLRWLIARFMPNDDQRKAIAVEKLERLLGEVAATLREAKDSEGEEEGSTRRDGRR